MPSSPGQLGVKLTDFISMWTEDGTKLIEQDRRDIDGYIWLLYSVYFPESTNEYGRHMAMLLKIDKSTDTILLHDLENMTGSSMGGGYRTIQEWFEKHAGRY